MFGTRPFSAFIFLPNLIRLDVLALSSCANAPKIVKTNSLLPILVMLAVRNCVSIPRDFSLRTLCKRSTVFLANREMSFTTTISNKPFSASASIRWNSLRFLILVPEIPSSAYNLIRLSPVRLVYSRKNSFCVSKLLSWSSLSVDTRQYAAIFMAVTFLFFILILLHLLLYCAAKKRTRVFILLNNYEQNLYLFFLFII